MSAIYLFIYLFICSLLGGNNKHFIGRQQSNKSVRSARMYESSEYSFELTFVGLMAVCQTTLCVIIMLLSSDFNSGCRFACQGSFPITCYVTHHREFYVILKKWHYEIRKNS